MSFAFAQPASRSPQSLAEILVFHSSLGAQSILARAIPRKSSKSFGMCSSTKCASNSFRIRTSKTKGLKSFRICSCGKNLYLLPANFLTHLPYANVVISEGSPNSKMTTTPASTQTAIQLDHVSRHYTLGATAIRAVDDVSLSIGSGEFVALLGSSGSGKSTLLNLMAGLDRPTSGAIHADGKNLADLSSLELARYRRNTIGMVFQSFNLLPRMTLAENVELPLRLAEVDHDERDARVADALQRVKLDKRTQHRPSELSGGEQQRTAIARALVNRPKILFADEPTGNLDAVTGETIMNLLLEIKSSLGMTIIMVTHERPLAEKYATRLAVMGDGKLLSESANAGPPSGVGQ